MCFSIEASFISSALLSVIGIASIRKRTSPYQLFFTCIPLFFAVQQFSEGMVWLSLTNEKYLFLLKLFSSIYLIFAELFWPFWVPFSVLMIEKNKNEKLILSLLSLIGLLISFYLAIQLYNHDVRADIINYHIFYNLEVTDEIMKNFGFLYLIVTILPLFISSINSIKMKLLGCFILFSYILSKLVFENYIISVWCFFAAIISGFIYLIAIDFKK